MLNLSFTCRTKPEIDSKRIMICFLFSFYPAMLMSPELFAHMFLLSSTTTSLTYQGIRKPNWQLSSYRTGLFLHLRESEHRLFHFQAVNLSFFVLVHKGHFG